MKIFINLFLSLVILLLITNCKKEELLSNNEPVSEKGVVLIQPDASSGKDAFLLSLNPSSNYGTHPDFDAIATTNGGTPTYVRSLIRFDFSKVPDNVNIDSVIFTLYGYNSPTNGTHRTLSGSNEATLKRVIENWNESTVTWNNQPNTTDDGAVSIPMSTSDNQNYSLDITQLALYMMNNPTNNFGFKIQLVTEANYRQLIFASSDNSNSALHPKVKVFYSPL